MDTVVRKKNSCCYCSVAEDLTFENAASQHMLRLLLVSSPLDEKANSENRCFPLVQRHVQPLHENANEAVVWFLIIHQYTSCLKANNASRRCLLLLLIAPQCHNAAGFQNAYNALLLNVYGRELIFVGAADSRFFHTPDTISRGWKQPHKTSLLSPRLPCAATSEEQPDT